MLCFALNPEDARNIFTTDDHIFELMHRFITLSFFYASTQDK